MPLVSGLHGYRMSGLAAGSHVGMPSRDITVIISLDEPMDMSVPGQGEVRLGSIVGGLHAARSSSTTMGTNSASRRR